MTPTKQAIEAARERLAKVADAQGLHNVAAYYRAGEFDDTREVQSLATALQEMSDAVKGMFAGFNDAYCPWTFMHEKLDQFILPKSATPLADCLLELDLSSDAPEAEHDAEWLEKALAKRGLQIVPVQS